MAALSKARLDAIGREYLDLLEVKARTEARITELQETLRGALELGPHLAGNAKVSIQRNVRRDDKAFMAEYPFDAFPDYYKPSIDTAVIKREIAPVALERFEIVGPAKVIVTAIEGAL